MSRMASWEPVVLGEAVAEYEQFLQSCRDNGTVRYSMSAVVRACDSLQYNITLWSNFPKARATWAAKLRDFLATTSAPAMHGGRQPVSAKNSTHPLRSNGILQDSDDASESSGRRSAPITISSSAEEELNPYEDEDDADGVYDADSIIAESVRKVTVDHSNLSGNRLRVGSSCKHYLVKWAGYPASQSTWTPACMCSISLVLLYEQSLSRVPHVPPPAALVATHNPLPHLEVRASAEFAAQASGPPPLPHLDVRAPAVSDSALPSAPDPSSNVPKKRSRETYADADVLKLDSDSTIEMFKARVKELNPECNVRIRGRDRVPQKRDPSIITDTVRLGCKHVLGLHPCQLSIYCDVIDGACHNVRRYTSGTCVSNICICCQSNQSDAQNVYKCSIGHLVCSDCISVMVLSEVQGEKAPLFIEKQEMKCSYCSDNLNLKSVIPLLTPEARAAYSAALCSVAAIKAEKETERRVRLQMQQEEQNPQSKHLKHIADLVQPLCPICLQWLPDFDGCCALQCGKVPGAKDISGGCGAHVCAWCQNAFVDGHTCHQHVLECDLNLNGIPAVFC